MDDERLKKSCCLADISANVIIFPYSVSELEREEDMIRNIADNISRLVAKHDSLFLIFNIRENSDSAEIDIRCIDEE